MQNPFEGRPGRTLRAAVGAALLIVSASGCAPDPSRELARGDALASEGKVAEAISAYQQALAQDPTLADAHLKLADLHAKQGDKASALDALVTAATMRPGDDALQVQASRASIEARRAQDAIPPLTRLIDRRPDDLEALDLRAAAYAATGDRAGAARDVERAIAKEATASRYQRLGEYRAAEGLAAEAEAAYRQAVALAPTSVDIRVALGRFLASTGRTADAETMLKAILEANPSSIVANTALADVYLAADRSADAEPFLKAAAAAAGDDPQPGIALADFYYWESRASEAIPVLEALSANPRAWAMARARLATITYDQGRTDEARRIVDEVIAKVPGSAAGRVARARILVAEGKPADAVVDARQAVISAPEHVPAYRVLGSALAATGDLDGAADAYRQALTLAESQPSTQAALAGVEYQRGQFEEAARLAAQAIRKLPRSAEVRVVLVRSLLATGENARARSEAASMVDALPRSAAAHAAAAIVADRTGDAAGARAAAERALKLDPLSRDALATLLDLDVREGRTASAHLRLGTRIERGSLDAGTLLLAGRTWAATGDRAKGEQFLRRALDADPALTEAYLRLVALYKTRGQLTLALSEWDALALRQPGAVVPPTLAAMIVEAQGKTDDAVQRYETTVSSRPNAQVASILLARAYAERGTSLDRAAELAEAARRARPDDPEAAATLGLVYVKRQLPAKAVPLLLKALDQDPVNPSYLGSLRAARGQAEPARGQSAPK